MKERKGEGGERSQFLLHQRKEKGGGEDSERLNAGRKEKKERKKGDHGVA